MEAISKFLQPIIAYPFATGFHWLLCGLAGFLIANSENHGGAHNRVIAAGIMAFFIAYEWTEFLRINDMVDLDIAQGFAAYLLAAFGTLAYHKYRQRKAPNAHRQSKAK